MSSIRYGAGVSVLGGLLYAMGGMGGGSYPYSGFLKSVEVFDGKNWSAGPEMPGVDVFGAAVIGAAILAFSPNPG